MTVASLQLFADELYGAWRDRRPVPARGVALSLDEADAVQTLIVERRLADGERAVGWKIGLTSPGARAALGADEPVYGRLLSGMTLGCGEDAAACSLIQPKVEGELAFVMGRDLEGPGVGAADVLRATAGVMASLEIVDSRLVDWRMTAGDMIADMAACGAFVVGDGLVDPGDADLRLCGMVMERNGALATTGAGAAAMGSPVNAVAWLANALARDGEKLRAGDVVLTGSLGALLPMEKGDNLTLTIGDVGGSSTRLSS